MTAARRTIGVSTLVMLLGLGVPPTAPGAPGEIAGAPLVYLRTGPGPTHQPLGVLSEGTRLETLDVDGAWTRVRLEDGREGFVYSTFIEELPDPTPTPTAEVVAAEEDPVPSDAVSTGDALDEPARDAPPPPTPDPFLLEEVARLRTEIDSLKRTVSDELATNGPERALADTGNDVSDAGLQTVAIVLVALGVGWILGLWYGRRRAQRSRLRF